MGKPPTFKKSSISCKIVKYITKFDIYVLIEMNFELDNMTKVPKSEDIFRHKSDRIKKKTSSISNGCTANLIKVSCYNTLHPSSPDRA